MKNRKWLWIVGIALILLLIPAVVFGPRLYRGIRMWNMVQQVYETESMSTGVQLGEMSLRLEWTQTAQGRVYILHAGEIPLYYSGGVIYLENGKGYDVSDSIAPVRDLLEAPWKLFAAVQTDEDAGVWTARMQGASLSLEQGDIGFSSAQIQWGDRQIELTLSPDRTVRPVPQAVLDAIGSGIVQGNRDLTSDLIRLVTAWAELSACQTVAAELTLAADCGVLELSDTLTVLRDRDTGIGCVEKLDSRLYFRDNKICTAEGKTLTGQEAQIEAAQLVGVAYYLLLSGDFTCENGIYRLDLDEEGMTSFAQAIAPGVEELNINFTSGQILVELEEEKLRGLSVSCAGKLDLLITTVPVSVSARAEIKERPEGFFIPQSVREALIAN